MKIKDCMAEIGFIKDEMEHLDKQARAIPRCCNMMYRTRLVNDIIKIRRDLNELRKEIERTVLEG